MILFTSNTQQSNKYCYDSNGVLAANGDEEIVLKELKGEKTS